jgi:uncharacterized protein
MLRELTANVMVPGYRDFARDAEALESSTAALCAAPDAASLDAAQSAWRTARASWQRTEAFALGPVVTERLAGDVDFAPVRIDSIEESLASGDAITPEWVASLGTASKGLPALEYLIFDPSTDGDAAVLMRLTSEPRRCEYAAALASDLSRTADEIVDHWARAEGGYAAELAEASETYPTLERAVSAVFNAMFASAELAKILDLGEALGREMGWVRRPELLRSPYAGATREDVLAVLDGVGAILEGRWGERDGLGLIDAVAEIRADAVPDIRAALDAAITAVTSLPEPLASQLDDPRVMVAYDAVKNLVRVLGTDVAALLGVTVAFTDADGD